MSLKVITHNFSFLNHLQNGKYSDLRLTTQDAAESGQVVRAHRVILAAVSEKLERVLDRVGIEQVVVVRNIRFSVLEKIVEFIYTGIVELEEGFEQEDFNDGLDMLLIKVQRQTTHEKTPRLSNGPEKIHFSELNKESCRNMFHSMPKTSRKALYGKKVVMDELRPSGTWNRLKMNQPGSDLELSIVSDKDPTVERGTLERDLDLSASSESDDENYESDPKVVNNNNEVKNSDIMIDHSSKLNPTAAEKRSRGSKEYLKKKKVNCEVCYKESCYDWYGSHCQSNHEELFNCKVKCSICGMWMASLKLRSHQLIVHEGVKVDRNDAEVRSSAIQPARKCTRKDKPDYKIKCDYCPIVVTSKHYVKHCIRQHKIISTRNLQCKKCGKLVSDLKMKHHMEVLHKM